MASGGILTVFGAWGPRGAWFGVLLTTLILTELITNNAAVVLAFPIAMATAGAQGMDPRWVALSIGVAASASFLTPIGYQTTKWFTVRAAIALPIMPAWDFR